MDIQPGTEFKKLFMTMFANEIGFAIRMLIFLICFIVLWGLTSKDYHVFDSIIEILAAFLKKS